MTKYGNIRVSLSDFRDYEDTRLKKQKLNKHKKNNGNEYKKTDSK